MKMDSIIYSDNQVIYENWPKICKPNSPIFYFSFVWYVILFKGELIYFKVVIGKGTKPSSS